MIVLLGEKRNLSREDAYTLCSLAADLAYPDRERVQRHSLYDRQNDRARS